MDFKVSGTTEGITGIQLDLKIRGLTFDIIEQTFARAQRGPPLYPTKAKWPRSFATHRPQISPHAPRLLTSESTWKIRKNYRTRRQDHQSHRRTHWSQNRHRRRRHSFHRRRRHGSPAEKAREEIERLSEDVKIGKIYTGKVTSIKDFGAFIEVIPGQDGLCHISELADRYLKTVGEEVSQKLGQTVRVKDGRDRRSGPH